MECPSCVVFSGFPATAYGPVTAAAVAAARGSGRGTRGRGGGYTAYGQNAGAGKRSVGILCGLTLSPCSFSLLWSALFFSTQHPTHKHTHTLTHQQMLLVKWKERVNFRVRSLLSLDGDSKDTVMVASMGCLKSYCTCQLCG